MWKNSVHNNKMDREETMSAKLDPCVSSDFFSLLDQNHLLSEKANRDRTKLEDFNKTEKRSKIGDVREALDESSELYTSCAFYNKTSTTLRYWR